MIVTVPSVPAQQASAVWLYVVPTCLPEAASMLCIPRWRLAVRALYRQQWRTYLEVCDLLVSGLQSATS